MNALRIEGQKTVAIEIVQQFDWEVPDWVVIPGGNLGNVSALGAGFQMMHELGLIHEAAAHLRRAGRERQPAVPRVPQAASSTFEPVQAQDDAGQRDPDRQPGERASAPSAALQPFDGVVEQASEDELADAAARADRTGMFNCPHTGVALAALAKLRRAQGRSRASERVVVISTANGLKFTDQKTAYHLGPDPRRALDAREPARSRFRPTCAR